MLNEQEWNTINNILLELYTIDDIGSLAKKLMKVIRMLIPYTKGYFILLDEDQNIIRENSYFIEMEDSEKSRYLDHFYAKDYLKYLYEITVETTVYQDTRILADDIRKSTDFYTKFLKPSDIPYGCGILIIHNQRIIGIFNLFRCEKLGDFSKKDIKILNILKKHIENMVHKAARFSRQELAVDSCLENATEEYNLTKREAEVLKLMGQGLSNNEICRELVVSLSTVKKHTNSVYAKTGVKNRVQLVNLIYRNNR